MNLDVRVHKRSYGGITENVRSWGLNGSQFRAATCLLVAITGLSLSLVNGRTLAHFDAGGGSRPLHQKRTFAVVDCQARSLSQKSPAENRRSSFE